MTQEELFNESKSLFGFTTYATIYLQNPGCIKNQNDIENICSELQTKIDLKERELATWKDKVRKFQRNLVKMFQDGKL